MNAADTYRGWDIGYEQPPIPYRGADWFATHPSYDGPGDARHCYAATRELLIAEIDLWHEENPE